MRMVVGGANTRLPDERGAREMAKTTIFRAKKIVTMNPSNPDGTHVAVRDGRILGAGSLEELTGWGEYDLDETFQDKVLVPGFVEAHAHVLDGGARPVSL